MVFVSGQESEREIFAKLLNQIADESEREKGGLWMDEPIANVLRRQAEILRDRDD